MACRIVGAIPRCLLVQSEEHYFVICQRTSKNTGYKSYTKAKCSCPVLDFLGHNQVTSAETKLPPPMAGEKQAPVPDSRPPHREGGAPTSNSYWLNLTSLYSAKLAI